MRDPHVVWLEYRLQPSSHVAFENPPPIEHETDTFIMRLSEGVARFEMKEHYASEEEAKSVVEEFLRAWEIYTALRFGAAEMRFSFERPHVIDRKPPPPGTTLVVALADRLTLKGEATVALTAVRRAYPAPPTGFRVSPNVGTLWDRYQHYREGREPLPGVAYFCLTFLETMAGGPPEGAARKRKISEARKKAAQKYQIDENVLGKLGDLSSTRGDARTARKVTANMTPLSPAEAAWIDSATREIIRRVGEVDAGATGLPAITMKHLPPLR
jgi:hypothetical protein